MCRGWDGLDWVGLGWVVEALMQQAGDWLLLPIQEGGRTKGLSREACRSNGSLNPFLKPSLGSTDVHMAGKEKE